ncbi:Lanc-like protein gcr2 [Thalictrum thalictroides]|uniref:Lanc-like protein gcr2 n=1 Tax=Thalictrum thalictroides TaxID=46969 RepID=A0A7J6VLX1_THATH|nr:Lanc-like protein gcr2 [Thalictrum thalictroides]
MLFQIVRETWVSKGRRVKDYTLYTGALGTAFLLFKAYQVTQNKHDLQLCSEIVHDCERASHGSGYATFICGRAGVCALGAVAAKHTGDEQLINYYLAKFKEIQLPRDVPNELLYGRAGFLWACLFINKHIGNNTIPSSYTGPVVRDMIREGRQLSNSSSSPLMYEWHGKKYWGAAHGLAGIVHVLMEMELSPDETEDVKGTLRYMIRNCFPSGNYPSSEGRDNDRLVHWCHGAPGVALTLVKAAEVFRDQEFIQAAADAGEVVWNRGLLKRVGICHGVSGNAYVFLSLYRLTGKVEFLYRAKAFACFLLDKADELIMDGKMHSGDHSYSLFEGVGGMSYLLLDMVEPSQARFPAYEL